jgi:AraC-like DNA-binding protein
MTLRSKEPALAFALPGTLDLSCGGQSLTLDRAAFFVVPAGARPVARVLSASARVAWFEIAPALRERTVAEYAFEKLDGAVLEAVLREASSLPRTTWVDELVHRYVFERAICKKSGTLAATFLEVELVKEVYFLATERARDRDRAPRVVGPGEIVARAIAIIDRDLFAPLATAELARRAGASSRTLLRAFRRELGCAPSEYLRDRRLDEARVLLRTGRYRVGDVASRLGYASLPAFSQAFSARFGTPPSRITPRRS